MSDDEIIITSRGKKARKKAAGGSAAISIAVHVLFIVAAGSFVALRHLNKPQATFVADIQPRPKMEPRKLQMKVKVKDLQKRSARPKLSPRIAAKAPSAITLPKVPDVPKVSKSKVKRSFATFGAAGFGSGIGGGDGLGAGGGLGGGLPTIMAQRCNAQDRMKRLKKGGGNKKSEAAVVKGLYWLKETQNEDGSWGTTSTGAMTGLALLCYMGHCELPDSPEFGETVQKAIDWLTSQANANGGYMHGGGSHTAYQHGIATYGLAEAYALTGQSDLESPLRMGLDIILNGQDEDGGWFYRYKKGQPSDTSVVVWQFQALKAASLTSTFGKDARIKESIKKATELLRIRANENGAWMYRADKPHASLSGAGTFGLQMGGLGKSDEAEWGLEYIKELEQKYAGKANLYAWYYITFAAFQGGGRTWRNWNDVFRDELVDNQDDQGSWPPEGTGKTDQQGKADAQYYRNCLNILMLEVYYRYTQV